MRRIAILVSLLVSIVPASATSIILHGGSGRDCYLETLVESAMPERNRQSLAVCNQAVADGAADLGDSYDYAAALINRADIKLRVQDYAGVVADAEKAIALDRTLAPGHLNRGAGLIGLKRYQDALPSLDKAIALEASRLEIAYYDRAIAKEFMGDILGAYHDYLKATQINPEFQPAVEELSRFKVTNS